MTKDFKQIELLIMTQLQKTPHSFLFTVKTNMIWWYLQTKFHSLFLPEF